MKLKDVGFGKHFVRLEEMQAHAENPGLCVYQKLRSGGLTHHPTEGVTYVTVGGVLQQFPEDDEVVLAIF